jgi:chromosome segregation ATPase
MSQFSFINNPNKTTPTKPPPSSTTNNSDPFQALDPSSNKSSMNTSPDLTISKRPTTSNNNNNNSLSDPPPKRPPNATTTTTSPNPSNTTQTTTTKEELFQIIRKLDKELKDEKLNHESEITQLNGEITTLKRDLSTREALTSTLAEKLSLLEKLHQEQQTTLTNQIHEQYQNELNQRDELIKQLQSAADMTDISTYTNKIAQLESDLSDTKEGASIALEQVEAKMKELQLLLQQQQTTLSEQIHEQYKNELNQRDELIQQLQSNNNTDNISIYTNKITQLESELVQTTETSSVELEQAQNKIHELETQLQSITTSNQQLIDTEQAKRTALTTQIEVLQNEVNELKKNTVNTNNNVEADNLIQTKLSQLEQEHQSLLQEHSETKRALEALGRNSKKLVEERDEKIRNLNNKIQTLEVEIQEIKTEHAELEAKCDDAARSEAEANASKATLTAQFEKCQRELTFAEEMVNRLEIELEEMPRQHEKKLLEVQTGKNRLELELSQVQEELIAIKTEFETFKNQVKLTNNTKIDEALADLEILRKRTESDKIMTQEQLHQVENQRDKLLIEKSLVEGNLKSAEKKVEQLEMEIKELKSQHNNNNNTPIKNNNNSLPSYLNNNNTPTMSTPTTILPPSNSDSSTITTWREVPPEEMAYQAPNLPLDSPVIQAVLEGWTKDRTSIQVFNRWAVHILNGRDIMAKEFRRGIELDNLSQEARAGFLAIIVPLLRERNDIQVVVSERPSKQQPASNNNNKCTDIRLKVEKVVS